MDYETEDFVFDIEDGMLRKNWLETLCVSASVRSLGPRAFEKCEQLESITVDPDNPFFTSCDGVLYYKTMTTLLRYPQARREERFEIPDGVRQIAPYAFKDCEYLRQIIMPSTLKTIGEQAFEGCSHLRDAAIPASVTDIAEHAFGYFYHVKTIYGSPRSAAARFAGKHGIQFLSGPVPPLPEDFEILKNIFVKYHGIRRNVVIPDGITVIGKDAFAGSDVQTVYIPEGVTDIENRAFAFCPLSAISISGSVRRIGDEAFRRNTVLTAAVIPDSVEEIGKDAFNECKSLNSLMIGSGVRRIEANAFLNCKHLRKVTIPPSVTEIGHHAFGFYFQNPLFFEGCHRIKKFSIRGMKGTAAERYAGENRLFFEEIL